MSKTPNSATLPSQVSRRSVAKGAAWTAPVLAVGGLAPAWAASCTPTTNNNSAKVAWVSTQTGYTTDPGGDPEHHTVVYTFTNNGPDPLPATAVLTLTVTIVVLSGEEATLAVHGTSANVEATAANSTSDDDDAGTHTDQAVVTITTQQDIASGETFTVTVLATFGALNGDLPDEKVSAGTVTTNDPSTCTTTITAVDVSGASDGTSYSSPS